MNPLDYLILLVGALIGAVVVPYVAITAAHWLWKRKRLRQWDARMREMEEQYRR